MKTVYLLVILCLITVSSWAQTSLSGIVNVYASLVQQDECTNTISITNAQEFSPGMGIIILQSTGADINQGNNSSYGTINDLNGCGQYEYNRIIGVLGNELELEYTLVNNYDVFHTQVVGFFIYENANVDGLVSPPQFDGATGGVVVIEVENTLTLNANISAAGAGFAGGQTLQPLDNNCSFITNANAYVYDADNWRGAPKGSGIALLNGIATGGRGPAANGGGGGNDHNSGGGGGALLSNGGQGGINNEPSTFGCNGNFPGLGGKALSNSTSLIFMGGGGGSGHSNNNTVTAGDGGGIIIVKAANLLTNGSTLMANGEDGLLSSGDGSGGGGAAGSILLLADMVNGELNVTATGGAGGSVNNDNVDRCFGPGGGGSGGAFRHNTSLVADLNGGIAGLTTNSADCPEGNNGATAGETGLSSALDSLSQGEPFVAPMILSVSNDTVVCPNEIVHLEVLLNSENVSYQWQYMDNAGSPWNDVIESATASGTQTNMLELEVSDFNDGNYRLIITPLNDCFPTLTSINIDVQALGAINANPAYTLDGNTANFIANTSGVVNSVEWIFAFDESSNELNPSYTYPGPGTYPVTFIYSNDCGSFSVSLNVIISDPLVASIGASSFWGCAPLTVAFEDQSVGTVESRSWVFPGGSPASSTNATQVVVFNEVGTYEVTLLVENSITSNSSSITIEAVQSPVPDFSVMINELMISLTNLSANADSYSWNFGDENTSSLENPTHTYSTPGVYEVSLNASNSDCGVAFSQTISVFTTANEEPELLQPRLFPNPVDGILQITHAAGSNLHIWSIHGQRLQTYSITSSSQVIALGQLPAGVYMIQLKRNGQQYWQRVLKM